VLSREFEIGAVGAVTPRPELVAEPLARDEIVLVCAPSHAWAVRDQVTLEELVKEPQLVQQQGAGVRSVVEDHLGRAGLRPEKLNVVMEMGLMESAKQAAIAGGGITFLSRWAIGPELEHAALVVVPIEGFRVLRDFYTVGSKTRVLSRAAESLLAFFREQYAAAG
jgi:DNA-binding transcriptional LysR family regulator